MGLSSKHCRTLCTIFRVPTAATATWASFVLLVSSLGGDVEAGEGSRRRMRLNGVIAVFHRPHPQPQMKKGSVESAREFLLKAGVSPRSEGCVC
jgi:hypothetical protein